MITRRERLERELAEAELQLDAYVRSCEPGMMRSQQKVAGQRARVFGLRLELAEIRLNSSTARADEALRAELHSRMASLRNGIKEAELSARAASKQATDDEIPDLMRRLQQADDLEEGFSALH